MSQPVLELLNATVIKGDRPVLNALTLTIEDGQHTAIVGPNGAGKSLLVKLLTHEVRALVRDDGQSTVRVFGSDNWDVFDLRSQLGIVSADLHQRFVAGNSEGRISGEAAVLSGFLASDGILRYGTITGEMKKKAADALERMGVSHLARRWLDELSSGEARRVLLARALVTSPRALVLDEPTTGLDLAGRHEFMERVRQIARPSTGSGRPEPAEGRSGTTLVLITHHIDEIVPEIQHVVLLGEGRIVTAGPKASVLTSQSLSGLFGAPIVITQNDGYYYARLG